MFKIALGVFLFSGINVLNATEQQAYSRREGAINPVPGPHLQKKIDIAEATKEEERKTWNHAQSGTANQGHKKAPSLNRVTPDKHPHEGHAKPKYNPNSSKKKLIYNKDKKGHS